ncbi:TRAP transporter permease [Natrialbaceae archaeon A-gly3]
MSDPNPDRPDASENSAEAGQLEIEEALQKERPGDAKPVSMRNVLIVLSIALWLLVLVYAYTQQWPRSQYGMAFLGSTLSIYAFSELMDLAGGGREELLPDLKRAFGPGNRVQAITLVISGIIVLVFSAYSTYYWESIYVDRPGMAYQHEYVMAVAFWLAMVYLTWRSFGFTFVVVLLVGLFYGYYGTVFPGPLEHAGFPLERLLRITAIGPTGFYGFLTQLVAAWIALFLLYAGLLKTYGAFDIILRLALRSMNYISSGVAQVAVLSSTVIGSINGSQTANAGMTGAVTIPLMKRNGIRPETAGGIESTASTAGQVLPPVMGAGAFIMASLVMGISYVDVLIAGILPATILVIAIVVAVHYIAAPQLAAADPENAIGEIEPMPRSQFAIESIKFLLPFFLLVYYLGIVQATVMTAAFYTVIAMIVTGVSFPLVQALLGVSDESPVESLMRTGWETIDGAREGIYVLAPVTIILAAINGVVDVLTTSGVPGGISLALMDLSGGELLYASILAMIICIVLGLGMPVTASYTIVALLVAPTFINQFFLPDLAAHFFVFYAAILSSVTPPIATACAVACGIAKAGFWRVCYEAIKISAPLFVLPFVFVFHPEIVSAEINVPTLATSGFALIGALAIIHGINYRFVFPLPVTAAARLGFFAGGVVAMAHPSRSVQVLAVGAVVTLWALQTVLGKMAPVRTLRAQFGSALGPEPDAEESEDLD